jgi:NADPH-dependent glutamate synthase beta subunit-like oxidoreductase
VPIEGSEFSIEIDTLIPAIGQEPDLDDLAPDSGLTLSRWGTIDVDPETFQTASDGVFAGGDVVTGPSTVVQAMAHGKTASRMIHKHIQGHPVKRDYEITRTALDVEITALSEEDILALHKPDMPELPPELRVGNFREVQQGLTPAMAVAEAKRCVRCDQEAKERRAGGNDER